MVTQWLAEKAVWDADASATLEDCDQRLFDVTTGSGKSWYEFLFFKKSIPPVIGKINILRDISLALRYLHQQDKTLAPRWRWEISDRKGVRFIKFPKNRERFGGYSPRFPNNYVLWCPPKIVSNESVQIRFFLIWSREQDKFTVVELFPTPGSLAHHDIQRDKLEFKWVATCIKRCMLGCTFHPPKKLTKAKSQPETISISTSFDGFFSGVYFGVLPDLATVITITLSILVGDLYKTFTCHCYCTGMGFSSQDHLLICMEFPSISTSAGSLPFPLFIFRIPINKITPQLLRGFR